MCQRYQPGPSAGLDGLDKTIVGSSGRAVWSLLITGPSRTTEQSASRYLLPPSSPSTSETCESLCLRPSSSASSPISSSSSHPRSSVFPTPGPLLTFHLDISSSSLGGDDFGIGGFNDLRASGRLSSVRGDADVQTGKVLMMHLACGAQFCKDVCNYQAVLHRQQPHPPHPQLPRPSHLLEAPIANLASELVLEILEGATSKAAKGSKETPREYGWSVEGADILQRARHRPLPRHPIASANPLTSYARSILPLKPCDEDEREPAANYPRPTSTRGAMMLDELSEILLHVLPLPVCCPFLLPRGSPYFVHLTTKLSRGICFPNYTSLYPTSLLAYVPFLPLTRRCTCRGPKTCLLDWQFIGQSHLLHAIDNPPSPNSDAQTLTKQHPCPSILLLDQGRTILPPPTKHNEIRSNESNKGTLTSAVHGNGLRESYLDRVPRDFPESTTASTSLSLNGTATSLSLDLLIPNHVHDPLLRHAALPGRPLNFERFETEHIEDCLASGEVNGVPLEEMRCGVETIATDSSAHRFFDSLEETKCWAASYSQESAALSSRAAVPLVSLSRPQPIMSSEPSEHLGELAYTLCWMMSARRVVIASFNPHCDRSFSPSPSDLRMTSKDQAVEKDQDDTKSEIWCLEPRASPYPILTGGRTAFSRPRTSTPG
ncbi:hypothetical protein L227DRAFT_568557 [Lentinus tigrinus ALCF2SS1-6]|uniref:Uncharacterized protein n=1 Tax=Lentinus tigrinus ALCF2SS1-6 TaxID=1328759 RepID=A0A5C2RPY7_9APHY|nr:hypothetical protein L227DRAFT_568557 [Lentinus tigrinus ALCF2SS1-6]